MRVEVRKIEHLTPRLANEIIQKSAHANVSNADMILLHFHSCSAMTWQGTVDGEIACVFGLIPPTMLSEKAYLWLLATDLVDQHKFVFIRYSQRLVEFMLERFPVITGDCLIGEERAIRWVKWLGGKFTAPLGNRLPFEIRKKNG